MPFSHSSPILALVALVMAAFLRHGTDAEVHCSNPPPGIQKMTRGVDITKLDLVPVDVIGTNGFKSPIINFSCSRNRTWRSPDGQDYQLPDQIWQMTTVPGGWLSAETKLYKNYNDVRRSMTTEVGGEGAIWKFAFSGSHSYKKMQNAITNTSRYVSDIASFESAVRADVIPSWILEVDTFAQMFIDRMITGDYETNPRSYNRFINQFGTHYFSTANFGGYIKVVSETTMDYLYSRSESEAKANAKASFLKIISVHGGQVSGSTTVDERFTSASTQSIRYYGGDTNLLTQNGIQQWQPTVARNPWLFSGELKPISDLITDETKNAGMIRAVENYVMRNYLEELERLIITARTKSNDAVLPALQTRITELKGGAALNEGAVDALSNDVEANLIVPEWFTSNTKLCYKWRADGDAGQCGGGAANLLCAKPNAMTPEYRDDTDSRSGGCQMQWGIQSMGFPSWFSQVRVCYQWYPDGDGGQCGGPSRLLCAGLNDFSPEYRDDTDRRSGGCRMSWKIEVPSSAPLWLRTAKMCFSWYPDGDGGQCGPAPSRNLCAVANQWTDYYRDDTDRRSGGCRMSWGIKTIF
ncbi:unnamed protein product [Lymnaea stagnalis]|uniref:MACPF domain-containing protein n=1 Tax=Lymnaea stagnalis TaxID=6523 RepID=A0AAV2H9B1_LYMST